MGDLITTEQVLQRAQQWALRTMSLSEILSYLEPEKRLEALEKILSNYTVEERLRGLSIEEYLRGLSIEERLRGLSIEECLRGLNPDDIRAYLKRLEEGQQ